MQKQTFENYFKKAKQRKIVIKIFKILFLMYANI